MRKAGEDDKEDGGDENRQGTDNTTNKVKPDIEEAEDERLAQPKPLFEFARERLQIALRPMTGLSGLKIPIASRAHPSLLKYKTKNHTNVKVCFTP